MITNNTELCWKRKERFVDIKRKVLEKRQGQEMSFEMPVSWYWDNWTILTNT